MLDANTVNDGNVARLGVTHLRGAELPTFGLLSNETLAMEFASGAFFAIEKNTYVTNTGQIDDEVTLNVAGKSLSYNFQEGFRSVD